VVVDISPAQTTTRTNFRYYIQAMKAVQISSDIPRSTARRMAEDQLRSLVKVRTPPLLTPSQFEDGVTYSVSNFMNYILYCVCVFI